MQFDAVMSLQTGLSTVVLRNYFAQNRHIPQFIPHSLSHLTTFPLYFAILVTSTPVLTCVRRVKVPLVFI